MNKAVIERIIKAQKGYYAKARKLHIVTTIALGLGIFSIFFSLPISIGILALGLYTAVYKNSFDDSALMLQIALAQEGVEV